MYNFCPAKATWDQRIYDYYNLLLISAETGNLPLAGGLYDQDGDFIDNLSWFLLKWDMLKFTQKAEMILGSDDKAKASKKPARR